MIEPSGVEQGWRGAAAEEQGEKGEQKEQKEQKEQQEEEEEQQEEEQQEEQQEEENKQADLTQSQLGQSNVDAEISGIGSTAFSQLDQGKSSSKKGRPRGMTNA